MFTRVLVSVFVAVVAVPLVAFSQELVTDSLSIVKARVVEVVSREERIVPGTDVTSPYQTIRVKILNGPEEGKETLIENDYLSLEEGDVFYLTHTTNELDGTDYYQVGEPYRLPLLWGLLGLFVLVTVAFGGRQGVRGLFSLAASFFFIVFLLLPGVLAGYSPVIVSVGTASLIVLISAYVTHGFNKMTTIAVLGMLVTIVCTGVLAHISIHVANLSGFTGDEATYLNLNTRGTIDLAGLLLGGILIGLLGVLYDAAIGQSVAVEELTSAAPTLRRKEVYFRALRIGREHIGALVNTLAIAYVGASLPLLLLFYGVADAPVSATINRELFSSEIVRILVGSIGVVLVVPITTLLASLLLVKDKQT